MPTKKDGMLFEIHPTPAKGKDGKNILYVKPVSGQKLSIEGLEDFCSRNYNAPFGELSRAFNLFLRAASELMAMGYRIDTPIGSFAPRLALSREFTDPDEIKGQDVRLDGVDYNPGKLWNKEIEKWNNGFRPANNPNTQELLADKDRLEQILRDTIRKFNGFITVGIFSRHSGLTYHSARKLLNAWCEGDNPKLLKTQRGHEYLYTEI